MRKRVWARRELAQRLTAAGTCSARVACRILKTARFKYLYRAKLATPRERSLQQWFTNLLERHSIHPPQTDRDFTPSAGGST